MTALDGQRGVVYAPEVVALAARADALDLDVLHAGIAWLSSEQEPDARVSQFGIGANIGPYYVQVTPSGNAQGEGDSVVIIDLRESERRRKQVGTYREVVNGIDCPERDALERRVVAVAPVVSAWNGNSIHNVSCSFAVEAEVSPGVRRAYANYGRARLASTRLTPFVTVPEGWR